MIGQEAFPSDLDAQISIQFDHITIKIERGRRGGIERSDSESQLKSVERIRIADRQSFVIEF